MLRASHAHGWGDVDLWRWKHAARPGFSPEDVIVADTASRHSLDAIWPVEEFPEERAAYEAAGVGPEDIGVALERLLHKNGVYTFGEIANWTREDVERVDAKLETFKGRIRRDKWIAQAKKLNKE